MKKCSLRMVLYELRNINGNFMPHFFGIVFPNLMCVLLSKTVGSQVPEGMREEVVTSIMLTMTLVIPMAIMLIGYGALYAQEVERGIPLRMRLFGLGEKCEVTAKIAAHLVFLTIAFVIFAVFQGLVMEVQRPALPSLLCLIVSLYLIGVIFLITAHAIANILQKFSLTFGVTMFLYFGMMILTGMMGMRTDQLPEAFQKVAATLPMTYVSNDFIDFWQGGTYNFMPFIQSFIFMGAASGILLLLSMYKNRRIS
ncbi:MAG: ABC transporter permease [Lachnospiraceae bacterium]|nr:ABC transporter permease [Lachnospiraceae bacterium]